jgi:hypothetical protein
VPTGRPKLSRSFRKRLEAELQWLKRVSGMGFELRVVWDPRTDGSVSGEVKNNAVFVYDVDVEEAVDTLRHEFIDYCFSQAIEPYRQLLNQLILAINREGYERKERVVDGLVKLLDDTGE